MKPNTLALAIALTLVTAATAESVKLSNGDVINGKIIAVSEKSVTIQSEVHGKLVIPRAKVVQIDFRKAGEKKKLEHNLPLDKLGNPRALLNRGNAGTPQQVVDQLRKQGVNRKAMDDLVKQMPLLALPQVRGYFNNKVEGLMSGKLNIGDIRKDAIKARNGLLDLKKDLGPEGAALDGYLQILDSFIGKTAPTKKPLPQPRTAPAKNPRPFRDPK